MKSKKLRFAKITPMSDLMKLARKTAAEIGRADDLVSVTVQLSSFDTRYNKKEITVQFASATNCLHGRADNFKAAIKNLKKDADKLAKGCASDIPNNPNF